ncbi:MAG: hypothetical protein JO323_10640 [Acidobacteriia bacterium]|nr:hypothetical protein [Terriglobia bacterium]
MKKKLIIIAGLGAAWVAAYATSSTANGAIDSQAAFSRLKTLTGEWEANSSMGKVHESFESIAGGTALVERETSEHMPPMQTVYHLDGNRLLLTHYCALGNQPRMQANAYNASTGALSFAFLDATNLASPGAGHMHNAGYQFADSNHFTASWELFENGKKKTTETVQFTRVR